MAVHPSKSESAHNQGIAREAKELVRAGWSVTATADGWDDPEPVGPNVPDIVATKRGTVRVVEVETMDDDYEHETMRKAVNRRRNAVFYAVIVDGNGRRIRYTGTN